MVYLDLDELPSVFDSIPGWSARRRALAEFRRSDHFGDPGESLRESLEALLRSRGISPPGGPIRLLTHLRYAGFVFNPVSFYYCFPSDLNAGEPEVIVAEVDNTPWGERHLYVLPRARAEHARGASAMGPSAMGSSVVASTWEFDKAFHVSPFMPMAQRYRWRFEVPRERIRVEMLNLPAAEPGSHERSFEAHLDLERRALTPTNCLRTLAAFPWMTGKVFAGIYWNALRLWLKGTPFFSHPRGNSEPQGVSS